MAEVLSLSKAHATGSKHPASAAENGTHTTIVAPLTSRMAEPVTGAIALRCKGVTQPPPPLIEMLLSTVLNTAVDCPIIVILPSTEKTAELVAIFASLSLLASDLEATKAEFGGKLVMGTRVRLYPTGEVFEVASRDADGGLYLRMTDKNTYQSNGTRYVHKSLMYLFEPTTRLMPLGTQFTKFNPAAPNSLDLIVGGQVFGNSALVRTRVLMIGTKAEFCRTLGSVQIEATANFGARPLREVFPYGGVGAAGRGYVVEPEGSAGSPLVALERDLPAIEGACLGKGIPARSRLVVTDRLDPVLRDLELAKRIAERQRLFVFVEARRRDEVAALRESGWYVWEPTQDELLGRGGEVRLGTGCPGIDASVTGALAENRVSPGFLDCLSPELAAAQEALERIGRYLAHESVEEQEWVEQLLDTAQRLFFGAAGWLVGPAGNVLARHLEDVGRVRSSVSRVSLYLGPEAACAVEDLATAVTTFREKQPAGALTPKGEKVLSMGVTANAGTFGQRFVTGSRQAREEADAFFHGRGLALTCAMVRDFRALGDAPGVVIFSVMRKNLFENLVDPWPSRSTLFVGYDFEIECYKRRLAKRHSERVRLRITQQDRERLTGLDARHFPVHQAAPRPDAVTGGELARLDDFDRATREWNWSRRIIIPQPAVGEELCEARLVRFAGRSWMAMTDEHESLVIAATDGAQKIQNGQTGALAIGNRIVVREGSDRDMIRLLAERRLGEDKYGRLVWKAGLWKRALKVAGGSMPFIRTRLEAVGVRRTSMTLRSWIASEDRLGPRTREDLLGIAKAFPVAGATDAQWKACWDAISELRGLHQSCGMILTNLLAERCGKVLLEPSDTELSVDLGIGIVWVLEITEIDTEQRDCPKSYVNRLHWLEPRWRLLLLSDPMKLEA